MTLTLTFILKIHIFHFVAILGIQMMIKNVTICCIDCLSYRSVECHPSKLKRCTCYKILSFRFALTTGRRLGQLYFCYKKSMLCYKSQFCVTKFISFSQNSLSVSQKSNLFNKIEICVTKLNFVSQNSILSDKSQFCVTKLNFVSQNSILCNKNQFCVTKINSV